MSVVITYWLLPPTDHKHTILTITAAKAAAAAITQM